MVAVTIRDVPEKVRDELAVRAAGGSVAPGVSALPLDEHVAAKPTIESVVPCARPGCGHRCDRRSGGDGSGEGCRSKVSDSRLVCDASALVTVLLDSGNAGDWLARRLASADLAAPALLPFECSASSAVMKSAA